MTTPTPEPRSPLRKSGVAAWLMRHLPEQVAVNPERTLLNLACSLVGLSTLVGKPPPALTHLYPTPMYEWGAVMLLGGLAVVYGMLARNRSVERLGMILVLVGCLFWGVLLVLLFGWGGTITAAIFFAFACAKALRLVVTSAARDQAIEIGRQMRESCPPRPPGDE